MVAPGVKPKPCLPDWSRGWPDCRWLDLMDMIDEQRADIKEMIIDISAANFRKACPAPFNALSRKWRQLMVLDLETEVPR